MILTITLQPLFNQFELENIKFYMNFSFFCLISQIYLVFFFLSANLSCFCRFFYHMALIFYSFKSKSINF